MFRCLSDYLLFSVHLFPSRIIPADKNFVRTNEKHFADWNFKKKKKHPCCSFIYFSYSLSSIYDDVGRRIAGDPKPIPILFAISSTPGNIYNPSQDANL